MESLLVDNVYDTPRKEDIWVDDLGRIDIVCAVQVFNSQVRTRHALDSGVTEISAVKDRSIDDVLAQYIHEIGGRKICKSVSNSLEGGVIRSKNGEVAGTVKSRCQVQRLDSACE